jgi:hypothetical protein
MIGTGPVGAARDQDAFGDHPSYQAREIERLAYWVL